MISVIGSEVTSALLEVVLERLAQRLVGAGVAELLDPVAGLLACRAWRPRRGRGSTLSSASSRRASRRSRARTCRPRTACPGCPRRTGSGRSARASCPRAGLRPSARPARNSGSPLLAPFWLWTRTLSLALSGKWSRYGLVGAAGLADAVVARRSSVLRAHRAADEDGQDHEGEPAEDGLLSVLGAPPTGARSEVVSALCWTGP